MGQEYYDPKTGLPIDETYLECGLPTYLQQSLNVMKKTLEELNAGKYPSLWDCDYCELQSSINSAEVSGDISQRQAWYLREKYLGIRRNDL